MTNEYLILRGLILAYSDISLQSSEQPNDKILLNHLKKVNKHLTKKKIRVSKFQKPYIDKASIACSKLDTEYFEDKMFSPFLVFFGLLEYVVLELKDTELQLLVSKCDIYTIRKYIDTYTNVEFQKASLDTNRFITLILEELGL